MILPILILILIAGGLLAWLTEKISAAISRLTTVLVLLIALVLVLSVAFNKGFSGIWIEEYSSEWIPRIGASFHFSLDGLSFLMIVLTFFIGIIGIMASWNEEREHEGFFNFNIMLALAGITGVFLSTDLFLFYFFWELMLIPTYFLIMKWGGAGRKAAAFKFFVYTQSGGLLLLVSIVGLYLVHGKQAGFYTFDLSELQTVSVADPLQMFLMLGFIAAFLVKIPAFPLHTWLADAYSEAPLAATLILSSLMAKTGVYGIMRFAVPLFPDASSVFAPVGMIIGIAGILYGAFLALGQTNLKRLVAYSSFSHMGFAILGVYALNEIAWQGVVVMMIVHAISVSALFIIAAQLYNRLKTNDITLMGGLWYNFPAMGSAAMVFAMASLGLPGLGNFVGEILILTGTFRENPVFSALASLGLLAATLYSLRMIRRVFLGSPSLALKGRDMSAREMFIIGLLAILIVIAGLFPRPVINTTRSFFTSPPRSSSPGVGGGSHSMKILEKDINWINSGDDKI